MQRTVFFISDGTGITTETIGHSLLTQFPDQAFKRVRLPFVDTPAKAADAVHRIDEASAADGAPSLVFLSIVDEATRAGIARSGGILLDLFAGFMNTLVQALGVAPKARVGQAHGVADLQRYENRIEATNYALTHDDGISPNYDNADLILVGVSRTGKTPTCLYLALHYGVRAANYPLTDIELKEQRLPEELRRHVSKIVGLTIDPDHLAQIRQTRRPDSPYASLRQCHWEVDAAESMLRAVGVETVQTTHSSIEEIASRILLVLGQQPEMF
jgi:regulator of PEP synthase PpsR (kinase-PPPase family)